MTNCRYYHGQAPVENDHMPRNEGTRGRGIKNILGSLELNVRTLARVHEQVLVVGGLLEDVGAQRVAHLPVVEVVEVPAQPPRARRRLAVGARPRDRVPDVGRRDQGGEDVECGLSPSHS